MFDEKLLRELNYLPEPIQAQLSGYIEYLLSRYSPNQKQMGEEEFFAFLRERKADTNDPNELIPMETAVQEVRQILKQQRQ